MNERAESGRKNPFRAESAMALAVLAVVFMILIPMPTFLLDFFLALQMALALCIFFLALGVRKATDFSVFPTILLLATVLGLALNISSTRLILLRGSSFDGKLIRAFGSFVAGGGAEGIVVGSMIFVIIIAVQLIVITKGSGRIAEVAARFALDALPGRQMAIDAEFSAGTITQAEAAGHKAALRQEADFYGQMDGASKFVSGNAKVAVLITLVNIVGGFIVGMSLHGEDFATALETYTRLTIGDGLLAQLPALLISVAAGIVVTKADSKTTFASQARGQFGARGGIFSATGAILALMAFLPGFPWYVLLPMAAVFGYVGLSGNRRDSSSPRSRTSSEADFPGRASSASKPEAEGFAAIPSGGLSGGGGAQVFSSVAPPEPFCLELGYGLVHLALDEGEVPDAGTGFIGRVTAIRAELSLETGVPIPPLRVLDSPKLASYAYTVRIRGDRISGGMLKPGRLLAAGPVGSMPEDIPADPVRDPRTGKDAFWISASNRAKAESQGFTVLTHREIILDLLSGAMRARTADFLGRQEVQSLTEDLRKDYPAVVSGLLSAHSLGDVQRVLQILLREKVSIRNTVVIFETLADYPGQVKDYTFLAEKARQALGRQIWLACLERRGRPAGESGVRDDGGAAGRDAEERDGILDVFTLSPALARELAASAVRIDSGPRPGLEPARHEAFLNSLDGRLAESGLEPDEAILVCPGQVRALARAATERRFPGLCVLSSQELPPEARVRTIAEIALPD